MGFQILVKVSKSAFALKRRVAPSLWAAFALLVFDKRLLLCLVCLFFCSLVQGSLWFSASSNVTELRNHTICISD